MNDQPGPQNFEVEIKVTWPDDTYVDAEPANVFVFTDMGENMCFALGFVPPPPGLQKFASEGVFSTEAQKRRAFLIPKSAILNLAQTLQKIITANAHMFPISENAEFGVAKNADQE
ncbi:hypothetical protein MM1218R_01458 [Mycobacterium marinum]|uniref:hypothetical protein n=1 Tax=Mycobacterium marinum TaxID=1781 RepID=UPI000E29E544|nr:hypothetical protein [Mycobacterium marinum]AXN43406.1 hypothetical protein MM1218R_01458 [Mycobacterium marinum]RFZ11541.1 hypothetical protein DE4381_01129 [Mycobacterium marinum]